jgi:hypothetical protein
MLALVSYALGVCVLCFISIGLLRRKVPALLIVAAWTLLGPILMQVLNYFHVGYLDPFWQWASMIQAAIALVASVAALMVWAAIEKSA